MIFNIIPLKKFYQLFLPLFFRLNQNNSFVIKLLLLITSEIIIDKNNLIRDKLRSNELNIYKTYRRVIFDMIEVIEYK